jgi:hypothetical protein
MKQNLVQLQDTNQTIVRQADTGEGAAVERTDTGRRRLDV